MTKVIINAIVNGLLGATGVVMTVSMNGQEVTSGILLGAGLTGLFNALKDIHALLQEPPK